MPSELVVWHIQIFEDYELFSENGYLKIYGLFLKIVVSKFSFEIASKLKFTKKFFIQKKIKRLQNFHPTGHKGH